MFILQRYIGLSVIRGFVLLALIMVSLFSIILLIEELDQVGNGSYNWVIAVKYVLLQTPKLLLDFAAFISLVGSILALGSLAGNQELVAIESVGVSHRSVTNSVLFAALILMTLVLINAQFVIPATLQRANVEKTLAIEGAGDFVSEAGYWAQSKHRFIHVKAVENGRIPTNVEIFEFNDQHELLRYLHADKVYLEEETKWVLQGVKVKHLVEGRLQVNHLDAMNWNSFLTAAQLGIIVSKPEALSVTDLYQFVQGLKQRGEQSYRYELLFWQKIMIPISAAIMILLGMPFVFGSQRSISTGKRITFGVLAGVTFYVISQLIAYTGSLQQWSPILIASAPSMIVLVILIFIKIRLPSKLSAA
ncbi:MAG: LPS export ABC transporter permease LptG [Gammaproteobacteria bacterium]|nr:LPS export ABC transporter permease LptG [Gammaproteobacteria bacterium]